MNIYFLSGDDYGLRNSTTMHNMGRLWRDEQFEQLHFVKYSPGSSKYNPSEYLILYFFN